MASIYDFSAKTIDGTEQKLGAYRGKTLLIVNVASKCGFTPQYEGLEALYRKFEPKGLVVLGFPCDQFGHQEPGNEAEIKNESSFLDDLGADSLDMVELVMALEDEFETEIPDEEAEKITTVQQAIDYVNSHSKQ